MNSFERRIKKIEEQYPSDDLRDVKDWRNAPTHALARYILSGFPPNYLDIWDDPEWSFLRDADPDVRGISDKRLTHPVDCYVALLLVEAPQFGGDPFYIERYRTRFPNDVLAAAYSHMDHRWLDKAASQRIHELAGSVEADDRRRGMRQ